MIEIEVAEECDKEDKAMCSQSSKEVPAIRILLSQKKRMEAELDKGDRYRR